MKKATFLSVSLFICMFICISVSTSNAATDRAFITYGNLNPVSGEIAGVFGEGADHIDMYLNFTNHSNQVISNIRFRFFDGNGNNVTYNGGYYEYPNSIPAHGANLINFNQIVSNYSTNKICSAEISWETNARIRPQILFQAFVKDENGNFKQDIMMTLASPNQ